MLFSIFSNKTKTIVFLFLLKINLIPIKSKLWGNMLNFPITATNHHPKKTTKRSETDALYASATRSDVIQVNLIRKLTELIIELKDISSIKTMDEMHRVHKVAGDLVRLLPGPATPEKLKRTDNDFYIDWREIARNQYSILLELFVDLFDIEWPMRDEHDFDDNVLELFKKDHNYNFTIEKFRVLTKFGNQKPPAIAVMLIILREILFDDLLLAYSFVDVSYNNQNSSKFDLSHIDAEGSELIQLLISVPEKVANKMSGYMDSIFYPDEYSRILLVHMLRGLYFISELNSIEKSEVFSVGFISNLFDRIIMNYNLKRESEHLKLVLTIFSCWAEDIKLKHLINNIFLKLKRQTIEIVAVMLLQSQPNIYMILDNAVVLSDDWNFTLTTRIPLLNFYGHNQKLIENLILYLAIISDDKNEQHSKILINLVLELLDIWASNTSIVRTPFKQRVYIAKLIILSIQYLVTMKTFKFDEKMRVDIRRRLFYGIQLHLQSANKRIQVLGQILTEIILQIIETSSDGEKLLFDYSKLNEFDKNLVNELREIPKRCKFLNENLFENDDRDVNEFITILAEGRGNYIEENVLLEKMRREARITRSVGPSKSEIEVVELKGKKLIQDPTKDEELDSDDDLVPYDMSNDYPVSASKRPKYLTDLRDVLVDTDDPDIYKESIENLEKMVKTQLPNNDISLAIDLIHLLNSHEMKYYVENFEDLRFKSMVAICCVHPKEIAKLLCHEIHTDVGSYTISKKIIMLNVLSEAAKQISAIDFCNDDKDEINSSKKLSVNKLITQKTINRKQEANAVISKRLESKTRYFATKTPHPFRNARKNQFSSIAGWFFFPLVSEFGQKQLIFLKDTTLKHDPDNQLILTFLHTIATIMRCSENCSIAPKFARDILNITTVLRFNQDCEIRWVVMYLIFTVLITLPPEMLITDFYPEFNEIRIWLNTCIQSNIFKNEPNEECRKIAMQILSLLDKLFANFE